MSINFHVKREPHKLISAIKEKRFTAVTLKLKVRAILWTKNSNKKKFLNLNILFWMRLYKTDVYIKPISHPSLTRGNEFVYRISFA